MVVIGVVTCIEVVILYRVREVIYIYKLILFLIFKVSTIFACH